MKKTFLYAGIFFLLLSSGCAKDNTHEFAEVLDIPNAFPQSSAIDDPVAAPTRDDCVAARPTEDSIVPVPGVDFIVSAESEDLVVPRSRCDQVVSVICVDSVSMR